MNEASTSATCPKCDKERLSGPVCPFCGVIYAKAEAKLRERVEREREESFENDQERLIAESAAYTIDPDYDPASPEEARLELILRAVAIPVVLLAAYLLLFSDGLRFVGRIFMSMWVHELGHATTAWLCGHFAFPGPWITLWGETRNPLIIIVVALSIIALGLFGLKERRPVLTVIAAILLVIQIIATGFIARDTARMLITFFGDGGALVIGTAFMLTVYSPRGSKFHQGWLRWGMLVIGAVAFADVLHTWIPALTDYGEIPFGIQERAGLSDASRLVDHHGWDERALVLRHIRLAWLCGLVMTAAYVRGILLARSELRAVSHAQR